MRTLRALVEEGGLDPHERTTKSRLVSGPTQRYPCDATVGTCIVCLVGFVCAAADVSAAASAVKWEQHRLYFSPAYVPGADASRLAVSHEDSKSRARRLPEKA